MSRSAAPFVVFGGIFAIGITTVSIVAIGHCQREEPYLDPVILEYRRRPAPRRAPAPPPPDAGVPEATGRTEVPSDSGPSPASDASK